MKPRLVTLVVGACSALAVVAAANDPVTDLTVPNDQVAALSGIDVPLTGDRGKELIEATYGAQPLDDLIRVARGLDEFGQVDPDADPGVRLRAYRAIGLYASPEARTALIADIRSLSGAQPGTEQLYLRAVIEALGEIGEPPDVPELTPYLDYEPSRDIRAATADALRHLGCACTPAIDPLRARYANDNETSEQVLLAISRALRDLGQTP